MYHYHAYGLRIHTTLPLPELLAGEETSVQDGADVTIRLRRIGSAPFTINGAARQIHATPEAIHLYWSGVGLFLVREGREMIIDPAPGVEERLLRLFTLSMPLALLLQQRGQNAVFHASAVAISGRAVAYVGVKGAGKSSIAATLHAQGHDLLADDILAVGLGAEPPLALPGFPRFKLWPDMIVSLGRPPETLPQLRAEQEKRGYRITDGFAPAPVPLRCIYILDPGGAELELEPLSPQNALFELMPHWYGARFGPPLLRALGLSTHFLQCANLAKTVTICRLKIPRSLPALSGVSRLVEKHLAAH